MNNKELYHYGIPGMRWGFRKETAPEYLHLRNAKRARMKNLTDDDLRKATQRLQLEKGFTKGRNFISLSTRLRKLTNEDLKKGIKRNSLEDLYKSTSPFNGIFSRSARSLSDEQLMDRTARAQLRKMRGPFSQPLKSVYRMTPDEVKTALNRARLEKKFKDLRKDEIKRGVAAVEVVLAFIPKA